MEKKADANRFSQFSFYKEKKSTQGSSSSGKGTAQGIFSIFSRGSESTEQDIESGNPRDEPTESTTLMSSIKAAVSKRALGLQDSISQTVDTGRNLKYFLIFLLIGGFLIFLSLLFLPVVVLSPHKFACLFTLGSSCILIGLGYYHGLGNFIRQCDKIRVIYFISLLLTLYSSIVIGSYILTMLFSVIQLFAMLFFL